MREVCSHASLHRDGEKDESTKEGRWRQRDASVQNVYKFWQSLDQGQCGEMFGILSKHGAEVGVQLKRLRGKALARHL